jgi:hypothetical protein
MSMMHGHVNASHAEASDNSNINDAMTGIANNVETVPSGDAMMEVTAFGWRCVELNA